ESGLSSPEFAGGALLARCTFLPRLPSRSTLVTSDGFHLGGENLQYRIEARHLQNFAHTIGRLRDANVARFRPAFGTLERRDDFPQSGAAHVLHTRQIEDNLRVPALDLTGERFTKLICIGAVYPATNFNQGHLFTRRNVNV